MGEDEERKAIITRKRLPFYRRVAYGTGNFINVLAISMWFPYNISLFQKVLELPPRNAGTIVLIAQIGGAVSTPFIGLWSDKCQCRIPGRRKVFQLLGVFSLACSFFFIWHDCFGCSSVSPAYKVLYYSCFAIVFEFGWAATQIGQLSLIPELTLDKNIQVELNSIRYSFTIIANLIVFSCFWALLQKFDNSVDVADLSPSDKDIFWIMALVVIGLGVPVSMIFQICIHESNLSNPPRLKWYIWLLDPMFYLTVCVYTAARLIVILPQTYLPLYFIDTLKMDKTSIAKGPFILYLSSFFSTLIVKRSSQYIGHKMIFFIGLAIVWGALIWFWVKDPANDPISKFNWSRDSIYLATILLGVGGAITAVISMTMIAYLVGPYAGSSAFIYGWVAFGDRISNGAAVKIIQQFQPLTKSSLADFYRHVLVFVPFAGTALGLFTITSMLLIERHRRRRRKGTMINIQQSSAESSPLNGNTCISTPTINTVQHYKKNYEAVET